MTIKAGGKRLENAVETSLQLKYLKAYLAAKEFHKFVMKHRDYKNLMAVYNTAKPMLTVELSELDSDDMLLNTPEATYDLRQGTKGQQEHNPEDYITKMTAVSPSDKGQDLWRETLATFFCNDQELIDYVQEIIGMAAIGKVYQEHMIIAYGGGANGKSTFWNTIARVLGSYSGKLSADALTMSNKRNVSPELAELKGKRLVIASEMAEGMRLNTAVVKQITSTDEIQAEKSTRIPSTLCHHIRWFFIPTICLKWERTMMGLGDVWWLFLLTPKSLVALISRTLRIICTTMQHQPLCLGLLKGQKKPSRQTSRQVCHLLFQIPSKPTEKPMIG